MFIAGFIQHIVINSFYPHVLHFNKMVCNCVFAGVPYGTWLLLPHVPVVLDFLHGVVKKFSSSGTSGHGKFRAPPAVETSILSRCVKIFHKVCTIFGSN